MELAAGGLAVAAISTVAIIKWGKWRKNCWFCNENVWITMKDRNRFTCPSCKQYNGFNEDGGYDKIIREQHTLVPSTIRYGRMDTKGGRLSGGGESSSPFCNQCIDILEKRRKALADWDPDNEDNWESELEGRKNQLERLYPLCDRCIMSTQRSLLASKQRYSYLLRLNRGASSVMSGLTSVSRMAYKSMKPSHRRRFFNGGPLTTKLHLFSLIISFILMITLTDALLYDCGMDLLPLPHHISSLLNLLLPHSLSFSLLTLFSHTISLITNRNRMSLPDLLSVPVCIWLCSCVFYPIEGENALISLGASSSLFLLFTAVTLLPRKRKHRKRSNNPITSAFSVASTPVSQVSSQFDQSLLLPTPPYNSSPSQPYIEQSTLNQTNDMEWESCEVSCDGIDKRSMNEDGMNRSPLSRMNGQMNKWRNTMRNETPMREVTPSRDILNKLNNFSLSNHDDDDNEQENQLRRRKSGPFPSMSFNPSMRSFSSNHNGTTPSHVSFMSQQHRSPSIRSLVHSEQRWNGRRDILPPGLSRLSRINESSQHIPSIVGSHMTSASQMGESTLYRNLLLILTFCSVCTFMGMVFLYYHTFLR